MATTLTPDEETFMQRVALKMIATKSVDIEASMKAVLRDDQRLCEEAKKPAVMAALCSVVWSEINCREIRRKSVEHFNSVTGGF